MSTENMSPVSKDKADKMSKKRRREEELAQSKEANSAAGPESTPAKKQKKSKKDRETAVKQEYPEEATEKAAPAKKEKKKKTKSAEAQPDETATQDAKPAASGATSNQDENTPENPEADASKKSKKNKKSKDTSSEAVEINGTEETKPNVSATTTTAISSKQLQSKSPFIQQTASFYLALSPIAHQFPLEGLCAEHISPLILTYYPPMKGVVLSYNDPRMSESPEQGAKVARSKESKTVLGQSVDEYAVTYIWLTVELMVFRPRRGTVLEAHVNLQNESILGLICYNYFNAGIERSRLPKDWQWVEDEAQEESGEMSRKGRREAAGHYVNADGNKVEGKILFKVKDFEATAGAETGSGSINIYGTLLSESEDAKIDEEARQKNLVRERPARR